MAWVPLALGVMLALCGCGPGFESVYEGSIRFEHCHRLDRERDMAPSQREYCWNEWVRVYTYGQTRDRVEYARRRLRSLRGAPEAVTESSAAAVLPHEPEPPSAASSDSAHWTGGGGATAVGTSTTSGATAGGGARSFAGGLGGAGHALGLPEHSCAETCRGALSHCKNTCQTAPMGCAPCEPDYRACMRRCFE